MIDCEIVMLLVVAAERVVLNVAVIAIGLADNLVGTWTKMIEDHLSMIVDVLCLGQTVAG